MDHINSLPSVLENVESFVHASDTTLIAPDSDDVEIAQKLLTGLDNTPNWMDSYKLPLNVNET